MKYQKGIKYAWFKLRLIFPALLTSMFISWICPVSAADKEPKPEIRQPVKEVFVPCHPPGGDMSPDGKLFVNAVQSMPELNILEMGDKQINRQIKLPKKAYDVVFIDATRAVLSYGPWGELAIIDIKQDSLSKPFKVGYTAEGMCKTSDNRLLVIDPAANRIYLVDLNSQSTLRTFQIKSKPAQMRWIVPDLQAEVADALGKIIDVIKLP